ncbi:hypothetical protein GX48_01930 [Paracoccidioides brasiliensis]|nr:hypothetical protein GX48_01930 [Paracoccidioides brasiliensis]
MYPRIGILMVPRSDTRAETERGKLCCKISPKLYRCGLNEGTYYLNEQIYGPEAGVSTTLINVLNHRISYLSYLGIYITWKANPGKVDNNTTAKYTSVSLVNRRIEEGERLDGGRYGMSVKEGEVQGMAFDDSGRANLTSIQGQFNKLIVKAYLYGMKNICKRCGQW